MQAAGSGKRYLLILYRSLSDTSTPRNLHAAHVSPVTTCTCCCTLCVRSSMVLSRSRRQDRGPERHRPTMRHRRTSVDAESPAIHACRCWRHCGHCPPKLRCRGTFCSSPNPTMRCRLSLYGSLASDVQGGVEGAAALRRRRDVDTKCATS